MEIWVDKKTIDTTCLWLCLAKIVKPSGKYSYVSLKWGWCLPLPLGLGKEATWGPPKDLIHGPRSLSGSRLVPGSHLRNLKGGRWAVCVTSNCHNKDCRQGGLNKRNVFLLVVEAGSPRSRSSRGWLLVRALFLTCIWLFSHGLSLWVPSGWEWEEEGSEGERDKTSEHPGILSYKDTNLVRSGPHPYDPTEP